MSVMAMFNSNEVEIKPLEAASFLLYLIMKARNGDIINQGSIYLFATARGCEVMKIESIIDSDVVYAKGVCNSGRRWICNILRLARYSESKNLTEFILEQEKFSRWYKDNIMRKSMKTKEGLTIHYEEGHTVKEWCEIADRADEDGVTLWNFSIEDMLEGAIEANEAIQYWLINGRLYETMNELSSDK